MKVERVVEGLGGICERYKGEVVVLVAHGFVAKVARAVSEAGFDDFFEWQLANGTVCELTLTARPSFKRTRLRRSASNVNPH